MKTINVFSVPVGEKFIFDGQTYQVTEREYPFCYAKCLTEQHEHDFMFGGQNERVQIEDNTPYWEQYFEQTSRNHYGLNERLIKNSPF